MKVVVFILITFNFLFGAFSGSYNSIYEDKEVFLDLKEENGTIIGSLNIENQIYKIDAKPFENSLNEAVGIARSGAKKFDIRLDDTISSIDVNISSKSTKSINIIFAKNSNDDTLVEEKKVTNNASVIKNRIKRKTIDIDIDSNLVGKWIGSNGQIWFLANGTYRYIKSENSDNFIPKNRFKKSIDNSKTFKTQPLQPQLGIKVNIENTSIQIGDSIIKNNELNTKNSYDNKNWRDKYKAEMAKKKAEEKIKNRLSSSMGNAGKWFSKNNLIYVSNSSGEMIYFAQFDLRENSMILIKNDGTQTSYSKINTKVNTKINSKMK